MSVSHVTPSFLHSHRHHRHRAEPRQRTEMERRHRTNLILSGIGVILFGILVVGFIGMVSTTAPTSSPSAAYGADGSVFVSPPPMATMWLAVIGIDLVAIFAFGLIAAFHNQQ